MAAAVVAAAVADALRRDGETSPPATTRLEERDDLAGQLTALGVRGEFVLHDGACGEATLSLPGLERRESTLACAPTGARSPDGRLVARCIDGRIEVVSATSGELEWFDRGCHPAWRPNRELTAERAGAVVHVRPCSVCSGLLVTPQELERAARLHPTVPERIDRVRPLIDGIAWLSNERAAVSISVRLGGRFEGIGPVSLVAFFTAGRLDATTPYFRATGGSLAASPRGSYVTLTPDVILRPDGSQVSLPPDLRAVRDFAWSPDERFLALATRFAVVVIPTASLERYDATGGGLRSVTIPQTAADLAWR